MRHMKIATWMKPDEKIVFAKLVYGITPYNELTSLIGEKAARNIVNSFRFNKESFNDLYAYSKCDSNDEYNETVGKDIAESKLSLRYHTKLLNYYVKLVSQCEKVINASNKLIKYHSEKIDNINNSLKRYY